MEIVNLPTITTFKIMKLLYTALFGIIGTTIVSCSSIQPMRVQVMRPAEITIAKDVQTVSILNRSIPTVNNSVETVLTGERPAQDKDLSNECVRGLADLLRTSDRFKIKQCENTMNASDPASLRFASELDWSIVDSICKKQETEALLVLEYFDTDFKVVNPGATAAATLNNVLNGNGADVQVTGTATANAGWRVYIPATKTVAYENYFKWTKTWQEHSTNPFDAVAKLIKPNQALMDVSFTTGYEFGMRIVPLYFWEDRSMYKGKKGLMERGQRQALARDWEGAIETWKDVYENSMKSKVKAKAAFNLALGYEVMGKIEEAQKWVQTSYIERDEDEALEYGNILDKRIREQGKLKQQIGE